MNQHVEYGYKPDFHPQVIWCTETIARRMATDYGLPLYTRYVTGPIQIPA